MNRQQRRAQAKLNRRKAQSTPKTYLTSLQPNRSLIAFGAYYKGDTDYGMGITFHTMSGQFTEEMLTDMYRHVVEDGNRMLQTYYMRGGAKADRQTMIDSLEQTVNEYNMALHGTPTQPNLGVYKDYAFNAQAIDAFVRCATYIAVLVCLGVISDDNQNGLHTMQTEKQFA
jgi:hypothetical protein